MRRLLLILVALLSIGFCAAAPRIAAADRVAIDLRVVYGDLAPYGHWVDRRPYGWVWVPRGMPVYWRPYTYGHWIYTDEYGWLWESDWPWGWAPFHYGRWTYDDDYGWVWVPGTEWAPAWVAWRYGDGWVGWAPLPPVAAWGPRGFDVRFAYIERYIRPTSWIFVGERDFQRPHVHRYAAVPARGVTILPRTANVTRYERVQNRIVDRSINPQHIQRATGKPVVRYRAREVETLRSRQQAPRQQRQVDLYRPRVRQAPPGVRPPQQAPARRTVSPQQLQRLRSREEGQRRELQQHQNTERRRIEQLYQRERQRTPSAPAVQQLRQREQQELRTLQQEHSEQERLLQRRSQRELPQRAPSEQRGTRRQQKQAPQDERRRRDQDQR